MQRPKTSQLSFFIIYPCQLSMQSTTSAASLFSVIILFITELQLAIKVSLRIVSDNVPRMSSTKLLHGFYVLHTPFFLPLA